MSSEQALPASYIHMVIKALVGENLTLERLLDGTGLSKGDIAVVESIPLAQLLRILSNARRFTGSDALGLVLGALLHPSTHGSLGWATINSPTLGDAVDLLDRYLTVQIPFYGCSSHVSGSEFVIRIEILSDLGDSHALLVECAFLLLQNMAEYMAGHEVADGRVCVDYPAPAYAKRYGEYLHCPVDFGAESIEYRLPVALRSVANSTANGAMYELALDQCLAASNKLRRTESLAATVEDLLEQHLEQQLTLEQVAHRLNQSPRTVIRKLRQSGSTFQSIRDEVYSSRASLYMRNSDVSVNGVSELLGFSGPANFRRTFKRWFGQTPSAYRETHSGL
jgi:AraC-like DNA-binding protein